MDSPLEVFSDLSERLHYNLPDFPLYVHKDKLFRYGYSAACHWHGDLEFIYALDGSMDYFVNGKTVHIAVHNGIFVNSKRLHYGFSTNKNDCTFLAVVINPRLLHDISEVVKLYLDKKFCSSADDFILLDSKIAWQQKVLLLLKRLYTEMYKKKRNPLRLLSDASLVCANTGSRIKESPGQSMNEQSRMVVWKMTGFIHRHYDEKITLSDIAARGGVCRSRCCEYFKKYIEQTPNTYLLKYRISKSYEMLRTTERTISEIALACGFQSASYFSSVFKTETGLTPQDYRKTVL
jgi:AraC-like DNA-binding protein